MSSQSPGIKLRNQWPTHLFWQFIGALKCVTKGDGDLWPGKTALTITYIYDQGKWSTQRDNQLTERNLSRQWWKELVRYRPGIQVENFGCFISPDLQMCHRFMVSPLYQSKSPQTHLLLLIYLSSALPFINLPLKRSWQGRQAHKVEAAEYIPPCETWVWL